MQHHISYAAKSANICRSCNLCGILMTAGVTGFTKHGTDEHPDHFLRGTEKSNFWKFMPKVYWSPPLNRWFASFKGLSRAVAKSGISNEDYYLKYGKDHIPDRWHRNHTDAKYGDARSHANCLQCAGPTTFDTGHWEYAVFCGFPCSARWHALNTDRMAQASKTIKEREIGNPTYNLKPNQLAYWTGKGLSENEAIEKVRERQSTYGLKKLIEKFGPEIGLQKHVDRQEKWLASLHKSSMYKGYSTVSEGLFGAVAMQVPDVLYGKQEASVRLAGRMCKLDCLKEDGKRVIEFYGDYWHANPNKYAPDKEIAGKTAQEIWVKDSKREAAIRAHGYTLLVVWEKDFVKIPNETIHKCVDFLNAS